MMNKLWVLFKNNFKNAYNLNAYSIKNLKNNKSKVARKILLGLFVTIYLLAVVVIYAQLLYSSLSKAGLQSILISLFVFITVVIMIIKSIFSAKTTIFNSEDNDMLFSMPIKPGTIFANRVISLLIVNYILELIILIPTILVYGINSHLSFAYYIISVLSMLFLPLIPVTIASIFGYLVAYISTKVKRKNLFEIVFQYIFLILIIVISYSIPNDTNKIINGASAMNKAIGSSFYVLTLMQNAILNIDIMALIKFVLINLAVFAVFIYILKFNYKSILLKLKNISNTGKYKEKILKVQNINRALLSRELKSYFSTPIYVINTSFGVLLILISSIATIFIGKEKIFTVLKLPQSMSQYIAAILMLFMGFLIGTINTTCCSISLEGNKLWIIKTLPIKTLQIFKSKINTNMVIMLPFTIISTIIFSFVFNIKVFSFIEIILFEVLYGYVIAYFGIISNLLFPKLDYKNPAQVVKQGFSSFISAFTPMIFVFLVVFVYLNVQKVITFNQFYYILMFALAILLYIENKIVKHWGQEKFRKLV